jgi:hypothetical protein
MAYIKQLTKTEHTVQKIPGGWNQATGTITDDGHNRSRKSVFPAIISQIPYLQVRNRTTVGGTSPMSPPTTIVRFTVIRRLPILC